MSQSTQYQFPISTWEFDAISKGEKTILVIPDFKRIFLEGEALSDKVNVGRLPSVHDQFLLIEPTSNTTLVVEIIEPPEIIQVNKLTDEAIVDFGISSLYPKSDFGGMGFYLPDKILEASPMECFEDYWTKSDYEAKYPFASNPEIAIFEIAVID